MTIRSRMALFGVNLAKPLYYSPTGTIFTPIADRKNILCTFAVYFLCEKQNDHGLC